MRRKKFIPLVGLLLTSWAANSQTSISVSSNTTKINGQTFEYNIGDMVLVSTSKSPNLIVTQGYLQPVTANKQAGTNPITGKNLFANLIKVYPNPTSTILHIQSQEVETISYSLYDALGNLVLQVNPKTISPTTTCSIDLSSYAAGSYFLFVLNANQEKLSFKIQKNNN